jgi:hypothetical protein
MSYRPAEDPRAGRTSTPSVRNNVQKKGFFLRQYPASAIILRVLYLQEGGNAVDPKCLLLLCTDPTLDLLSIWWLAFCSGILLSNTLDHPILLPVSRAGNVALCGIGRGQGLRPGVSAWHGGLEVDVAAVPALETLIVTRKCFAVVPLVY